LAVTNALAPGTPNRRSWMRKSITFAELVPLAVLELRASMAAAVT
jgi:hypothetical protein